MHEMPVAFQAAGIFLAPSRWEDFDPDPGYGVGTQAARTRGASSETEARGPKRSGTLRGA